MRISLRALPEERQYILQGAVDWLIKGALAAAVISPGFDQRPGPWERYRQ